MAGLTALGEKQVNYGDGSNNDGLAGTQADPAVLALPNGNYVIVYENPFNGGTDIDLLAHFFDANGNPIAAPAPTTLQNGVVGIDRVSDVTIHPALAATATGFNVIYTNVTQSNRIDIRPYINVTGAGNSFTVFDEPTKALDNAAIATFANGSSLVAWEVTLSQTDHDVEFAIVNSSLNGFVKTPNVLANSNAFEGNPRIATSGNLGVIVYEADPGTLNGGKDIVLRTFNSSGTEVHSPVTIMGNFADSDIWSHPDVTALSDGRFAIIAQDDTNQNIRASIFDPSLNQVVAFPFQSLGSHPHVAGTPDGGFVSSWDAGNGFIDALRTGPSGLVVQGVIANSGTSASENAIAANASGTVFLAWQDAGASNPHSSDTDARIEAQAFNVQLWPPRDFDRNEKSDLLWQNDNGQPFVWLMNGTTVGTQADPGGNPGASWHVRDAGDFNRDGSADILWQNDSGQVAIWLMNGTTSFSQSTVGSNPGPTWHAIAAADFNADGRADILWQNDNGFAGIWLMNGTAPLDQTTVGNNPGPTWHVKAAADFNGDGRADILWQDDKGQTAIWLMNGTTPLAQSAVGNNPGPSWHIKDAADFNADGKADILWQNDNGQAAIWLMDGLNPGVQSTVGSNPGLSWHIKDAEDFNGDGNADILWQNDNGQAAIWLMNGLNSTVETSVGSNPGAAWHLI